MTRRAAHDWPQACEISIGQPVVSAGAERPPRLFSVALGPARRHCSVGVIYTMRSVGISVLAAVSLVVVVAVVLLLQPISGAKDTPLMRAYSRLHQTSAKLRFYADEHSTFPGGVSTNSNIDALISIGILSTDDVALLRDHQVRYCGFDLGHVAADVPVFKMVFTNTKRPRRIVSFSDGHTVMSDLRPSHDT